MKESANFTAILDVLRKNVHSINRDFNELRNLQSSTKGTYEFANRCVQKASRNIMEQLLFARPSAIVEMPGFESDVFGKEYVFRVNPICGFRNFQRNLPYFAIGVSFYKNENNILKSLVSVIIVPSVNKIYYAERGNGAWVEDFSSSNKGGTYRLRVAGTSNLEDAIILDDDKLLGSNKSIDLGCPLLEMVHLASGNIDVIVADDSKSKFCQQLASLIVIEAGGKMVSKDGKTYYYTPALEKSIMNKIG